MTERTWKPRLSDALAFVLGASIVTAMLLFPPGAMLPSRVLGYLCPGFLLGITLVGGLLDAPGWGWILPSAFFTNGLLYALVWYLARITVRGRRAGVLVVVLGVGLWTAWYVQWCIENMPTPEPPIMPVDLASPLAGRWEGVMDGVRFDPQVILICHPRTDGTLDGLLYVNGYFSGPFFEGEFAGDSLYFEVNSFQYGGHRDSSRLVMESRAGSYARKIELRFVSADTTRLDLPDLMERHSRSVP